MVHDLKVKTRFATCLQRNRFVTLNFSIRSRVSQTEWHEDDYSSNGIQVTQKILREKETKTWRKQFCKRRLFLSHSLKRTPDAWNASAQADVFAA